MLSYEQSKISAYFKNAIKDKSVRHSYILSGDKGLGKKYLSDKVCLTFACEKGEGCGTCPACQSVKRGACPDVSILERQDGKEYPIDEIRDLISQVYKKPVGQYKLVVFKDAHLLNEKCQNALLKTIEEPPPYAVFMFVCENKLTLLPTVRSRSLSLELHPWKKEEFIKAFPADMGKEYFYDLSGGNPLKFLTIQNDSEFETLREAAIGSFVSVLNGNDYDVYDATDVWLSHKENTDTMLDCLYMFLRDVMLFRFGHRDGLANTDKLKDIQNIASKVSEKTILSMTETLGEFISALSKYDNLSMAVQTMFMRIKEEIND